MGVGDFKQPPAGPQIGRTVAYKDLPEDRKRELGDMAKAAEAQVFKPVGLDPRIAAEEEDQKQEEKTPDAQYDVGVADPRLREAAESFAALQSIVDREQEMSEDTLRRDAMPNDEDKQEFLRCVLGGKRYRKSYSLFGGIATATFVELTPADDDDIFIELGRAQAAVVIKTEDDWALMFERLRMMHSLARYARGGDVPYVRDQENESLDRLVYECIPGFVNSFGTSTVYQAVLQSSRLFRTQLEIILEGATNSDFWEAGGQPSQSQPIQEVPSTTAVRPQVDRGTSSSESSSGESRRKS